MGTLSGVCVTTICPENFNNIPTLSLWYDHLTTHWEGSITTVLDCWWLLIIFWITQSEELMVASDWLKAGQVTRYWPVIGQYLITQSEELRSLISCHSPYTYFPITHYTPPNQTRYHTASVMECMLYYQGLLCLKHCDVCPMSSMKCFLWNMKQAWMWLVTRLMTAISTWTNIKHAAQETIFLMLAHNSYKWLVSRLNICLADSHYQPIQECAQEFDSQLLFAYSIQLLARKP